MRTVAAITYIYMHTLHVFQEPRMSLKSFCVFPAVTFSPAGSHVQISPFERMMLRTTKSKHARYPTDAPRRHSLTPVLQWKLCSSTPFISSPPLLAVCSSFVLHIFCKSAKILLVFHPSVNTKRLCLGVYPHEKKTTTKCQNLSTNMKSSSCSLVRHSQMAQCR